MITGGTKISIIGAGYVGGTYAFDLVLNGLARELVLVDKDAEALELVAGICRMANQKAGSGWEIETAELRATLSERLGTRFAAKEATMKALGTGWRGGVQFTQIEVRKHPTGRPELVLSGAAAVVGLAC